MFLEFFGDNLFLAWCALWLGWVPVLIAESYFGSRNTCCHCCEEDREDEEGEYEDDATR